MEIPRWLSGKRIQLWRQELQETSFGSWVGKIPWRRKWQSTSALLSGKSHGQRRLIGYSPWGHKESDTTEQFHFHLASVRPRLQNGALMKAELIPGCFWITVILTMFSQLFFILFLQVFTMTLLPIESNLNIHLIQGLIKGFPHFKCVLLFWCFLHCSVTEFRWGNELCLLRHKPHLFPSTLLHQAMSLIQEYFQSF